MPYRRLPNTDIARIRALKAAGSKGDVSDLRDLPLSLNTLSEARSFLRKFDGAQEHYMQCLDRQTKASRKHQACVKTARLYLSHFIQVLHMAVIRGEIKETHKKLYGLSMTDHTVPDLTNEASMAVWGKNVIEGEQKRTAQGGVPIYTPTIAKVKVHYELFLDSHERQKNLQAFTSDSLGKLAAMRSRADELILDIWNQLEEAYQGVTPNDARLNLCRDYGLIYYYRTGEQPAE